MYSCYCIIHSNFFLRSQFSSPLFYESQFLFNSCEWIFPKLKILCVFAKPYHMKKKIGDFILKIQIVLLKYLIFIIEQNYKREMEALKRALSDSQTMYRDLYEIGIVEEFTMRPFNPLTSAVFWCYRRTPSVTHFKNMLASKDTNRQLSNLLEKVCDLK